MKWIKSESKYCLISIGDDSQIVIWRSDHLEVDGWKINSFKNHIGEEAA